MCSSWWAEGEQGPSRMISTSACVFLEGCLLTIINCIVFSQVHDQESTREKPLWHEEFQEAMVSPDQPWVYLPQNQRWGKPHSPQQWKYNFMLLFFKSSFSLYFQERALCAASPLKTFWLWRGWRKSHSGWKMWASATFCLQSAFTPARDSSLTPVLPPPPDVPGHSTGASALHPGQQLCGGPRLDWHPDQSQPVQPQTIKHLPSLSLPQRPLAVLQDVCRHWTRLHALHRVGGLVNKRPRHTLVLRSALIRAFMSAFSGLPANIQLDIDGDRETERIYSLFSTYMTKLIKMQGRTPEGFSRTRVHDTVTAVFTYVLPLPVFHPRGLWK